MKEYIATYWRSDQQLKNGGYETTRTIEARSIVSARKKARELAENVVYGGMTLLRVDEA